jgi:hypothetical protein
VCVYTYHISVYTKENVLDEGFGAPERGIDVLCDHLVLEQARDIAKDDDNGVEDRRDLRVLWVH